MGQYVGRCAGVLVNRWIQWMDEMADRVHCSPTQPTGSFETSVTSDKTNGYQQIVKCSGCSYVTLCHY
jgi:hypothetical protein